MSVSRNIALLGVALVSLCGVSHADSGSPAGPGPFFFTFDEVGNGTISQWDPAAGQYSTPYSNPGFTMFSTTRKSYALTYRLPEFVVPDDVTIAEPDGSGPTDGKRFSNDSKGGLMQYYSDYSSGAGNPLADTGFPIDFNTHKSLAVEQGSVANNWFLYTAGNGDPARTNFYKGISDAPEPGTIALLVGGSVSGAGLLLRTRRI